MVPRCCTVSLPLALVAVLMSMPTLHAESPSDYRGFRLGMSIEEVARHAGLPVTAAKTVFELPMIIQEMEWLPSRRALDAVASADQEAVARVVFGFAEGTLYRIVVSYDRDRTEGMTDQDFIDALSVAYGPPRRPLNAQVITSSARESYSDIERVSARWEDAASSMNLFRGAFRTIVGLVFYSKAMAAKAQVAIGRALRAAELDAPRREAAEQKMRDELEVASHAKARLKNKAAFRY
jgi:hypothetical protein